jgi:hypothetical protein
MLMEMEGIVLSLLQPATDINERLMISPGASMYDRPRVFYSPAIAPDHAYRNPQRHVELGLAKLLVPWQC